LISLEIENELFHIMRRKPMYEPVKSDRLFEKVTSQIEQRILDGDLQAGDKLPSERDLSKQFQVSRLVIRESLRVLANKGLVEVISGKGAFITDKTRIAAGRSLELLIQHEGQGRILDLMQLREILEPAIAAQATLLITDEQLNRLQECITTMDETEDPKVWIDADLCFHLTLAEATQNVIFYQMINTVVDLLHEQRLRTGLIEGSATRGQFHHKKIQEFVLKNDSEGARQAMVDHMQQAREDTLAFVAEGFDFNEEESEMVLRDHLRRLHRNTSEE
jgi:GntR family transcriptional repressor for pyruvate dehydrogenase complex